MSDRAKIRSRRVSGNDTQQQREVARAIKNAREMGLLPYLSKVTTQRRSRGDRADRPERGDRADRGERAEARSESTGDGLDEPVTAGAAEED
jgi:small subunit ribosomal protein S18